MATPQATTMPVTPDTLITIKVMIDGTNRRFKLPLHELGAQVFLQKLRILLDIPTDRRVVFERYSDSAASFVTLDSNNPAIFKQLYRAAKAKLKLRLRATLIKPETEDIKEKVIEPEGTKVADEKLPETRSSYLDTVLSQPTGTLFATLPSTPSFKSFQPSRAVCAEWSNQQNKQVPFVNCQRATERHERSTSPLPAYLAPFTITCNHCHHIIPNAHYHCGICDQGDFDLCQTCIDNGITCDGDQHWLIKRTIFNGAVVTSTTETLPPKPLVVKSELTKQESMNVEQEYRTRTCNGCIRELPASEFLTCKDCPDFDLCFVCFEHSEHGHHPGHVFEAVDKRDDDIDFTVRALCKSGRGHQHEALCDGCERRIVGIRHKCLSCPDWDFCNQCIAGAPKTHPGHRFAKLYEPLESLTLLKEFHRGIYCDGPLCAIRARKSYIRGDRYKCAVCHDTDFCAGCEAHPSNTHNKTHPLIKIKTPIRNVTISTVNELDDGQHTLGDRPRAKNASTETTQPTLANAATQVQTVAEVKPAEVVAPQVASKEQAVVDTQDLDAHFESESTPDGSTFAPNHLVLQCWTLRNPGPRAWPAGCAVHYIGGDDMRNLDVKYYSSVDALETANHSSVLTEQLEPGQTANFSVILKSPLREGRAISYWRLKTADGVPFGHKLWVDITVKTTPVELPLRPAAPVDTVAKEEIPSQSATSSTMIFPKLDKESPVSSVHNVADASNVQDEKIENQVEEESDGLEDVESVELDEVESEDDDAFLTDEEYDILDASDEDLVETAPLAKKK